MGCTIEAAMENQDMDMDMDMDMDIDMDMDMDMDTDMDTDMVLTAVVFFCRINACVACTYIMRLCALRTS